MDKALHFSAINVPSRRKRIFLSLIHISNWQAFEEKLPTKARIWFVESGGPKIYTEAKFSADDYLVFGRETAGLPKQLLEQNRNHWLRIPMFNEKSRSLNLSNCAALVLFEALRQQDFNGEIH